MLVTGKIYQKQRSEPNQRGKKEREKNHSERCACSYKTFSALGETIIKTFARAQVANCY